MTKNILPCVILADAAAMIAMGARHLEYAIEAGGFLHPESHQHWQLSETENKLRKLLDEIETARVKLVAEHYRIAAE